MKYLSTLILFFTCSFFVLLNGRSRYRKSAKALPTICTYWQQQASKKYCLSNSHLHPYVLFKIFDKDYFMKHLLPSTEITYRYEPEKKVDGKILGALIEKLVLDLRKNRYKRKNYEDVSILKMTNFNFNSACGTLIIKFKKYPFVAKLFIETPESFAQPYSKGFESTIFFVMGGGANRYIAGFTRIKNLEHINSIIQNSEWKDRIALPRKWFWLPTKPEWFVMEGFNMGDTNYRIELPSIYALICDAVEAERSLSIFNEEDRVIGMQLSELFDSRLDPHIDNFMIEKGTKKIILIDTEHFPTIVGLRKPLAFRNYFGWYRDLTYKCAYDAFGRSKQARKEFLISEPTELMIP